MSPNTKIQDKYQEELVILLNTLICDESSLFIKTKDARWKISGVNFPLLHLFFQSQYETIELSIKTIAVLINSLGHLASGTLVNVLGSSYKVRKTDKENDSSDIFHALQNSHNAIILSIQKFIIPKSSIQKDQVTTSLMIELIAQHKQMTFSLNSYQV